MNPLSIFAHAAGPVGGMFSAAGANKAAGEQFQAARPGMVHDSNRQAARNQLAMAIARTYMPEGVFADGLLKELSNPVPVPKRMPGGLNWQQMLGQGLQSAGAAMQGARTGFNPNAVLQGLQQPPGTVSGVGPAGLPIAEPDLEQIELPQLTDEQRFGMYMRGR